MSISRLLSLFVALLLVVGVVPTIHAGIATSEVVSNGQDILDCFQPQPGSAISADPAAPDWVERHAASLKPAATVASDWVERHAASLKAGNAVVLSNCVQPQPGSASPADTAGPDWVERYAASLKAGNAANLSDYYRPPALIG